MSDIAFGTFDQIEVTCSNLNVHGSDLTLDSPARRKPGGPRLRRALVHDESDGLTINFNGDYVGGVTLVGVTQIVPHRAPGILQALIPPTLVVRGGISYEVQGTKIDGGNTTITVSLTDELAKLDRQVFELAQKVAALGRRYRHQWRRSRQLGPGGNHQS